MANTKLKKIKKELENNLERYDLLLNAWESVSFATKKDGTPFKVMSKNFGGATYKKEAFADYHILEVVAHSPSLGYLNDWLRLTDNCTDLEEIKKRIDEKKTFFKREIETYQERLQRLDNAFLNFEKAYTQALGALAYDLGCTKEFDSLFYTIRQEVCK